MNKLNIIIGSTRPSRNGPAIARWFETVARQHAHFEVNLVDLADFNLPLFDEPNHPIQQRYEHGATKRWAQSAALADSFVFVTPEYDGFPPASLVNAMQVLMHEWAQKPAGIVSYGGPSGGQRSGQVLKQLLGSLNMMALPRTVALPMFFDQLNEDGIFTPPEAATKDAIAMLSDLYRWSDALQAMRDPAMSMASAA
jgi:NAD(P)H-dependent FMN reductase